MNFILLAPLALIVLLCFWLIWRGLRRGKAQPGPSPVDDQAQGLSGGPGGGATPR